MRQSIRGHKYWVVGERNVHIFELRSNGTEIIESAVEAEMVFPYLDNMKGDLHDPTGN